MQNIRILLNHCVFAKSYPSQEDSHPKARGKRKGFLVFSEWQILPEHKIREKILPAAQFTETFSESAVQMRGQILA